MKASLSLQYSPLCTFMHAFVSFVVKYKGTQSKKAINTCYKCFSI
jgi:hypothetical protein